MQTLPINYPFPSEISPHAEGLDERSLAWAKRFGLVGTDREALRLQATQPGLLVARAYPRARPVALQLMTDWITWGFLWDDQFDETGVGQTPGSLAPVLARLNQILSGSPIAKGDGPAERALADLRVRMIAERPDDPEWIERFSRTAAADYNAFLWESRNREQGIIPSVAEYHQMRMLTSAAYSCFVFSELMNELRLPREAREHPVIKQIAFHANTVLSWYNDLLSLPKELAQGDVHNIVLVVQHEQQCSLEDARAWVLADHDSHLSRFLQLQDELPSFGPEVDAQLRRYLGSMGSWMKGQLEWSLAVQRYKATRKA